MTTLFKGTCDACHGTGQVVGFSKELENRRGDVSRVMFNLCGDCAQEAMDQFKGDHAGIALRREVEIARLTSLNASLNEQNVSLAQEIAHMNNAEIARLTAALAEAEGIVQQAAGCWSTAADFNKWVHHRTQWLASEPAQRGREMAERLRRAEAEREDLRRSLDGLIAYTYRWIANLNDGLIAATQDTPKEAQ